MLHRHDHALWLSGYTPDTTVQTTWRLPEGVPVPLGDDVRLLHGCAVGFYPRAWRKECRVLIEQDSGVLSCRDFAPVSWQWERRMELTGLHNATVRIVPYAGQTVRTDLLLNSRYPFMVGDPLEVETEETAYGTLLKVSGVSGTLLISDVRLPDECGG